MLDPDKYDEEEINILNIRGSLFLKTFEKTAGTFAVLVCCAAKICLVLSKISAKFNEVNVKF